MTWHKLRSKTAPKPGHCQPIWVACADGGVYLTRWDRDHIAAFHFDNPTPLDWTEVDAPPHPRPKLVRP